jgi:hypothetical protein
MVWSSYGQSTASADLDRFKLIVPVRNQRSRPGHHLPTGWASWPDDVAKDGVWSGDYCAGGGKR